jgi:hypothetical protein
MIVPDPPAADAMAAAITARAELITAGGQPLGSLTQRFRFSGGERWNRIDVAVSISANRGDLLLGDCAEGGLAVRLTEEFRDDRGVDMINSEGATGVEIWGKPARGVDYSARIFGSMAGVAILDHPANLRYPTRWNAQDDGLVSANPFGAGSFKNPNGNGQKTEGRWTIRQGSALALLYRVVIHEGGAEEAGIEAMHAEFAKEAATALLPQTAEEDR